MKLNIRAFTIAHTIVAAILFAICSFFVGFLPETSVALPDMLYTRTCPAL